jgi:hypothetical protein
MADYGLYIFEENALEIPKFGLNRCWCFSFMNNFSLASNKYS